MLRTSLLRLGLVAAMAFVLGGCVGGHLVEETPRPRTLEGTLEGGTVGNWDCVWVIDSAGVRTDVMYPIGWEAKSRPVRLLDPSGAVVAQQGDYLIVTGPEGIGESVCGPNVFEAETVQVVP